MLVVWGLPILATLVVPDAWLARQLSVCASRATGLDVDVAEASLRPGGWSPHLVAEGVSVGVAGRAPLISGLAMSVRVAPLAAAWGGAPVASVELRGGLVRAALDDVGAEREALAALGADGGADGGGGADASRRPDVAAVRIVGTRIELRAADGRVAGLVLDASANARDRDAPSLAALLEGELGDGTAAAPSDASSDAPAPWRLDARLGGSSLRASARPAPAFGPGTRASLSLAGDDLSDLAAVAGLARPRSPPYALEANLVHEPGGRWRLVVDEARAGDSAARAVLTRAAAPSADGSRATLAGEVVVTRLELDDFLGAVQGSGEPSADEGDEGDEGVTDEGTTDESVRTGPPARVFAAADVPDWFGWPGRAGVDLDLRLDRFAFRGLEADGLTLAIDVAADAADVRLDARRVAGGELSASFATSAPDATGTRSLRAGVRADRVDLGALTAAAGRPGRATGTLAGEATWWLEGRDAAGLAASLDGGAFVVLTDGGLDRLFLDIAGFDLFAGLATWIGGNLANAPVRCGFADVQARDGRLEVREAVLDTAPTVFVAKGEVDLADETLRLSLTPYPRDFSLFSAPSRLTVRGTLARPRFRTGGGLVSRIAAAVVLGTVATPAAALLAFVDPGLDQDTRPCSELIDMMR